MLLTVSKRIDFSASRRLFNASLSSDENRRLFGDESTARYGTGRNYAAYFIFSGQIDATTGMLINISDIKTRAGVVTNERYDHRFLNDDNASFQKLVPTTENVASQIFKDVSPLFTNEPARLVAIHLRESPERSATAYADGTVEANYWFEFSAARQTRSPRLSDAENQNLFGVSVHEHGHNYRTRLTLSGNEQSRAPFIPAHDISDLILSLRAKLDHKNLSQDVEVLRDRPTTTESLARFILQVTSANAVTRVRLHEREDFFAEAWRAGETYLGMRRSFSAAHRLHVPSFSEERNTELFSKCNNPRGHGHRYVTEATIGGEYDMRTGALYSFERMRDAIDQTLGGWHDKHLDLETPEFRSHPSTGENIVRALWSKLDSALEQRLVRLRLWETDNNRFTVRRT
jgi:6-pyruvoyltetrahydropterin/6-carboxytetrahydropterin synthase